MDLMDTMDLMDFLFIRLLKTQYLIYIEFIILSFFSDSSDFNYIKNTFLIQQKNESTEKNHFKLIINKYYFLN